MKTAAALVLAGSLWAVSGFMPAPNAARSSPVPGPSSLLSPPAALPAALPEDAPSLRDDPPMERPRVGIQAGHWRAAEAPAELARIRSNGTRGGGLHESEVTLRIAELVVDLLLARGVEAEVLPATVPPAYRADLFISVHADGHNSPQASGFSIAAPRRDQTGVAREFVELLAGHYAEATGLRRNRNVTRQMENYYAFNSRRYTHSIDPRTPAVILETGFLTSPADRRIIVDRPELSAQGIADAVLEFLGVPPGGAAPLAAVE